MCSSDLFPSHDRCYLVVVCFVLEIFMGTRYIVVRVGDIVRLLEVGSDGVLIRNLELSDSLSNVLMPLISLILGDNNA